MSLKSNSDTTLPDYLRTSSVNSNKTVDVTSQLNDIIKQMQGGDIKSIFKRSLTLAQQKLQSTKNKKKSKENVVAQVLKQQQDAKKRSDAAANKLMKERSTATPNATAVKTAEVEVKKTKAELEKQNADLAKQQAELDQLKAEEENAAANVKKIEQNITSAPSITIKRLPPGPLVFEPQQLIDLREHYEKIYPILTEKQRQTYHNLAKDLITRANPDIFRSENKLPIEKLHQLYSKNSGGDIIITYLTPEQKEIIEQRLSTISNQTFADRVRTDLRLSASKNPPTETKTVTQTATKTTTTKTASPTTTQTETETISNKPNVLLSFEVPKTPVTKKSTIEVIETPETPAKTPTKTVTSTSTSTKTVTSPPTKTVISPPTKTVTPIPIPIPTKTEIPQTIVKTPTEKSIKTSPSDKVIIDNIKKITAILDNYDKTATINDTIVPVDNLQVGDNLISVQCIVHFFADDPNFLKGGALTCSELIEKYSANKRINIRQLLNAEKTIDADMFLYQNLYDFIMGIVNFIITNKEFGNADNKIKKNVLENFKNFIKDALNFSLDFMNKYKVTGTNLMKINDNLLFLFYSLVRKLADYNIDIPNLEAMYGKLIEAIESNIELYRKYSQAAIDKSGTQIEKPKIPIDIEKLIERLNGRRKSLADENTKLKNNIQNLNSNIEAAQKTADPKVVQLTNGLKKI